MKKTLICLLLFFCTTIIGYSQLLPDSVLAKYNMAKSDEEKGKCLYSYFGKPSTDNSNSITDVLNLSSWFKNRNDQIGADYIDLRLSYYLVNKGDFPAALNLCFPILARFEKRNDNFGIIQANSAIANVYFLSKSYEQAAVYSKKKITLTPDTDVENLSKIYNGIGCIYGEAGMPDSGMVYAQKAVNIDTETKNYQRLALSISTLAENYIAAKEYDIALPFLRKSLDFYNSKKAKTSSYLMAYLKNDFAQVFLATQLYDSAIIYSQQALQLSIPNNYKDQSMRSYEYLYKSYEDKKQPDSVNKYFRFAMTTKDSLFNIEKTRSIEALSFREQMRQQELANEKVKAEEERRENIQYALIAIGIISIIIVFLFLSRSFITSTKFISFFGVVALLLVFEFLNLMLHPFLERITHHSPILMLLSLVAIAALLVPLHHKLEKWATSKLIEKNKATRLEKAKKTIEKLEGGSAAD